jgi:hypothetical protein
MKMVIAVSGYAQSGKDTFADSLEYLINGKHKSSRHKFAEPLRKATGLSFEYLGLKASPWTEDKEEKAKMRPVLVAIGEYARSENPSVFADLTARDMKESLSISSEIAIVTDMRYENENKILRNMCQDNGYKYFRVHMIREGNRPANETESNSISKLLEEPVDYICTAKDGDFFSINAIVVDLFRTHIKNAKN